jgi:uridine kinase
MKRFQVIAKEILDYINDEKTKQTEIYDPTKIRFIIFGESGSGKTRAVNLANESLTIPNKVAESQDLLYLDQKDLSKALNVISDPDLAYVNSRYIGFNVADKDLADLLEAKEIKVFRL